MNGLIKLVVGSLLCSERFFSGFSGFPLSSKINISKLQFDRMQDLPENHFRVSRASWVNINYYYYYLLGVGRLPPQPESLHRHFSLLKVRKGDFVTTFFGSRSDGESSVLLLIIFYPLLMWCWFDSGFIAKFGLSLFVLGLGLKRGFSLNMCSVQ